MVVAETKVCSSCQVEKPLEEFYKKRKNRTPNAAYGNGLRSAYCKPCAGIARMKAYHVAHYQKDIDKYRSKFFNRRYGITLEQYDAMREDQGNRCYICDKHYSNLVLDHDHVTLKNRAFLCRRCNMAVSVVEDIEYMKSLIEYVESFK